MEDREKNLIAAAGILWELADFGFQFCLAALQLFIMLLLFSIYFINLEAAFSINIPIILTIVGCIVCGVIKGITCLFIVDNMEEEDE